MISGNTYFWEYLFRVFGIVSLHCNVGLSLYHTASTRLLRFLHPLPSKASEKDTVFSLSLRQSRESEAEFFNEIQTKYVGKMGAIVGGLPVRRWGVSQPGPGPTPGHGRRADRPQLGGHKEMSSILDDQ